MLLNFIGKGSYLHLHYLYFIHYINLRMFFLKIVYKNTIVWNIHVLSPLNHIVLKWENEEN